MGYIGIVCTDRKDRQDGWYSTQQLFFLRFKGHI